jgi:hypothetical protein
VKTDFEGKLINLFFGEFYGTTFEDDDPHGLLVRLFLEVKQEISLQDEVPFL